jgi:hypothetical protein
MTVERNSMSRGAAVLAVFGLFVAYPSAAGAHGPVAPVASSYLAKVQSAPADVDAKVVDGDQQVWLRVRPGTTVVVLDYMGAPYLRFSPAGVSVNRHSAMYYLNHSPTEVPPPSISRATLPEWQAASPAHDYLWHDGRLHALASVAISSSTSFVGTWRIPLVIDGRPRPLVGGLWHAHDPSIVWFWPIAVVLACVLAAARLRRRQLDRNLARALGVAALAALVVGGVGQQLYGRPTVGAFQLVVVAALPVFGAWALIGALRARYFALLAIAFVALWIGSLLVPTLFHGYVLTAIPAFLSRAAAVVCLACAPAVILLVFRLALSEDEGRTSQDDDIPTRQSFA